MTFFLSRLQICVLHGRLHAHRVHAPVHPELRGGGAGALHVPHAAMPRVDDGGAAVLHLRPELHAASGPGGPGTRRPAGLVVLRPRLRSDCRHLRR